MPIIRLSVGVLKTQEFAHLADNPKLWTRLKALIKDESQRVYALVTAGGIPQAYAVCSYTDGSTSLLCSYFEDLVPNSINRPFWLALLDYTGFDVLRIVAPTEAVGEIVKGYQFKLVEEMWVGNVTPYRDFPVSQNIHSVSGDAFYKLSEEDVKDLHELIWQCTVDEIETDVLGRRLSQMIPHGMDEVLNRTGDYHYEVFVLREPELKNKIIGFAYCHKLEPGYIAVGGLGVRRDLRGKRHGRKLAAAVLEHASGMADKVYATVLAENAESRHLFANVLKFKPVMSVYGITRDEVEKPVPHVTKVAAAKRTKQILGLL